MSIRSLRAAMSFLTVVPVANADGLPGERLGRVYFPAIGALVGLGAGLVFVFVSSLTTPLLAAACGTAALAALTGAIHLDGLADSADGLFKSGDVARRLEVMRDPRLGSYGVTAIVIVLMLDVAALSSMPAQRALISLVIAGALSRAAVLYLIAFVPYVRASGLGVVAWESKRRMADLAVGSAFAAVACLLDWKRALVAIVVVALVALSISALARRRLGGATGDICGATAELTQLATLLVFTVR